MRLSAPSPRTSVRGDLLPKSPLFRMAAGCFALCGTEARPRGPGCGRCPDTGGSANGGSRVESAARRKGAHPLPYRAPPQNRGILKGEPVLSAQPALWAVRTGGLPLGRVFGYFLHGQKVPRRRPRGKTPQNTRGVPKYFGNKTGLYFPMK